MAPSLDAVMSSVDGYRVEGVLGRGASGVVYRVRDPDLDRSLALKLLTDDRDEDSRARFRLEAKAAAKVIHPNVVQVYGAGEHEGQPYILQELVDGLAVSKLLEVQGRLSVSAAAEIALQAAAGLAEAARVGVLHRDVKPHNLLLTEAGQVKLADFGIAKLLAAPSGLTEQGTTLGTPHYMSPEQGRGQALDARSDQYALGSTLFHLLAGRPPFDAAAVLELLRMHAQDDLPDLRELRPECPPGLVQVVERMLAKAPGARFDCFEDVQDALEEILEADEAPSDLRTLGATKVPAESAETPVSASSSGRERAFFAAVGLAAAAVVATALWARPGPPRTTGRTSAGVAQPALRVSPPLKTAARDPFVKPRPSAPARAAVARGRAPKLEGRSVGALVRDLRRSPARAARAAEELGRRADQAATFPLIDALERSRDPAVIEAASQALTELADIRALERLDALSRTGRTPAVRAAARRAHRSLYRVEE